MKEPQFSFGILMTDFLEAALREMASSVPVARLCQSPSPSHKSSFHRQAPQAVCVAPGKNAADGGFDGLCASAGAPPAIPDAPRPLSRGGETKTSVVELAWILLHDIWQVSGCSRGLSALLDFFLLSIANINWIFRDLVEENVHFHSLLLCQYYISSGWRNFFSQMSIYHRRGAYTRCCFPPNVVFMLAQCSATAS